MSCGYENVKLISDFNLAVEHKNLEVFMNTFYLECFIKKLTCFQSTTTPNCVDLILKKKKEFFKNPNLLQVGIFDHRLIVTALRSQLVKGDAKIKLY